MDELRAALELASDEELLSLTNILFQPKFNPLDYLCTPDPIDVQSQSRQRRLDMLETRFRFLAADGFTVLRHRSSDVTYRQVLIQICRHLKIPYSQSLSTADLEAEVFLHLIERIWRQLPNPQKRALKEDVDQALSQSPKFNQLPLSLQREPIGLLFKGGGALVVNSLLRPWLLRQITRQFAIHLASYQVAKQALVRGGVGVAAQIQSRTALTMASRGMTLNAVRYTTVSSLFAALGPALWIWFFADLGWRSISTNYGRVIPVVFALAQIRLIRTDSLELAHC